MRFGGFFEGEFRVDGTSEAVCFIPYVEGEDTFPFGASCRTGCAVEVGASRAFCAIGLGATASLAVACGTGGFGGVQYPRVAMYSVSPREGTVTF